MLVLSVHHIARPLNFATSRVALVQASTLKANPSFARAMSQKTLFEAIKEDHEEVRVTTLRDQEKMTLT